MDARNEPRMLENVRITFRIACSGPSELREYIASSPTTNWLGSFGVVGAFRVQMEVIGGLVVRNRRLQSTQNAQKSHKPILNCPKRRSGALGLGFFWGVNYFRHHHCTAYIGWYWSRGAVAGSCSAGHEKLKAGMHLKRPKMP